jgi:hypothetical protein
VTILIPAAAEASYCGICTDVSEVPTESIIRAMIFIAVRSKNLTEKLKVLAVVKIKMLLF